MWKRSRFLCRWSILQVVILKVHLVKGVHAWLSWGPKVGEAGWWKGLEKAVSGFRTWTKPTLCDKYLRMDISRITRKHTSYVYEKIESIASQQMSSWPPAETQTHFPNFLWLHIARKALQSIRKHQEQSGFDPSNCATRQNQSGRTSNILRQSRWRFWSIPLVLSGICLIYLYTICHYFIDYWIMQCTIVLCKRVQLTSLAVTCPPSSLKDLVFSDILRLKRAMLASVWDRWSSWWMNDIVIHVEAPISWVFVRCERIEISAFSRVVMDVLLGMPQKGHGLCGRLQRRWEWTDS